MMVEQLCLAAGLRLRDHGRRNSNKGPGPGDLDAREGTRQNEGFFARYFKLHR